MSTDIRGAPGLFRERTADLLTFFGKHVRSWRIEHG